MNKDQEKIEKIKELQKEFRNEFTILKKTKDAFLKLFRSKLEERKIEEIKKSIISGNQS